MECKKCKGNSFIAQGYVLVTTPIENITDFSDLSNLDVLTNPETLIGSDTLPLKRIMCDDCLSNEYREVDLSCFRTSDIFEDLQGRIKWMLEINRKGSSEKGYELYDMGSDMEEFGMNIMEVLSKLKERVELIEEINADMHTKKLNDLLDSRNAIEVTW